MPKLLFARLPTDDIEERQVHKLAASRHAPGDWILRARMIARSWDGLRTTAIAAELGCHPQTVRERIGRFNIEGLGGLGDRPGPGRKPRLTEAERGAIIALAGSAPPGQLTRQPEGTLAARDERQPAHWTLNALTAAAQARGIAVARSQVRRILLREGVSWRKTHSWAESEDPDFAPKGRKSFGSIRTHRPGRPSSASTNWGR
jgi:transposase